MMVLQATFIYVLFAFIPNFVTCKKKYFSVTAEGCIRCDGQPVRMVRVKLMDKDFGIDDTMKTSRAGYDGCFKMTGKGRDAFNGKPDPYIRVEFVYSGLYGKMEVEKVFGINRYHKTSHRSYKSYINFGKININSIHCKAYTEFYKAVRNYKIRSGRLLPFPVLHVRTGVVLAAGAPYALYTQVRIPKNYATSKLDYYTAKHELAHTVRHKYDGSMAHFLGDVIKYKYMQHHNCDKKTNYGFAFNEGWAAFWGGGCTETYHPANDYKQEGNVAKALRKLRTDCTATDAQFINVLRSNPKKIHSIFSFNSRFHAMYGCRIDL